MLPTNDDKLTDNLLSERKRQRSARVKPVNSVKITQRRLMAAIESDNGIGFCVACGEETSGVEPDARKYRCESCGKSAVYGAEEILFHIA